MNKCPQIMVFTFWSNRRQPWSHNTSNPESQFQICKKYRVQVDFQPFPTCHPLPIVQQRIQPFQALLSTLFPSASNYHFPLVDHPAGSFEILRIFWQWILWIIPSSDLGFLSHSRIWYILEGNIFNMAITLNFSALQTFQTFYILGQGLVIVQQDYYIELQMTNREILPLVTSRR